VVRPRSRRRVESRRYGRPRRRHPSAEGSDDDAGSWTGKRGRRSSPRGVRDGFVFASVFRNAASSPPPRSVALVDPSPSHVARSSLRGPEVGVPAVRYILSYDQTRYSLSVYRPFVVVVVARPVVFSSPYRGGCPLTSRPVPAIRTAPGRSPRGRAATMHMLFPNILFWMYVVLTLAEPPYIVPFKGQLKHELYTFSTVARTRHDVYTRLVVDRERAFFLPEYHDDSGDTAGRVTFCEQRAYKVMMTVGRRETAIVACVCNFSNLIYCSHHDNVQVRRRINIFFCSPPVTIHPVLSMFKFVTCNNITICACVPELV